MERRVHLSIAVVVGNPKSESRTLEAGKLPASKIDDAAQLVVDVATLGDGLFGWGSDEVKETIAAVCACDVAVFASPTYKSSYTGILKIFLDLMPAGGLTGSWQCR
jgi:FMN reductase